MGVPDEVIEVALAGREAVAGGGDGAGEADARPAEGERASSHASDEQAAGRLLERRGRPILREPDPRRRRARAYALLARNGFDPDVCRAVAAAWLAADETSTDE
jgi:SOS response regulatory protein OraA/RecX